MFETLLAAAAPSLIGGLLGGSASGGGSQSQTVNKDPWAPAQDWMKANLASGQNLQNQYMANPFSAYQTNAYGNSQQLSQNARALLGSLIPQMSGQTGFDRNNPLAKPQGYNFTMPQPSAMGQTPMPVQNLGIGPSVNSAAAVAPAPAPAPVAPAAFVAAGNPEGLAPSIASYYNGLARDSNGTFFDKQAAKRMGMAGGGGGK